MIRSKSELEKKIIETNDNNIFSIVPKTPIGIDYSNKDINENILKNNSSNKGLHKRDSSKEFKIGNYQIKQTLGEGTFGKVKLGIYIPTNEKVAIKIIEKDRMTDKDDVVRLKREFDMLSKFNHPNVILVTEIFESTDSYYSVMEYCEKGELFNYIVNKNRLSENETSFFYFQIINGLEYIHSLGIVHRDLKPENLLISKEHLLKIIDFGLSNYFTEGQTELLSTPCGSPCYASPEMVAGKKYDGMKIDVWSTGIILFAMLCGYLPFEDKNNDVLFDKILECKIEFPDFLSEDAKDLINKILVVDPEERITIKEIKKHKFYLKGKKFFDEIFTIKQIDAEDENNEIKNEENNGENINNKNEDATSNIKEDKDRNIENNNREENIDAKNKEIVYINEEKDDLNENKENINSNMNIVENTLPEETENIEKKRKINPKLKIEKNKNSEDLIPNGSNSSNRNNNNNNKITKKAKQLNNKYFQLIDKKLNQNQRKIDINDEPKENNFKRSSGTKKIIQK
jgi:5'-AMP-activated protein kinase catalytic alpha subunit